MSRRKATIATFGALAILAGALFVSPAGADSGLDPIAVAQVQKANCQLLAAHTAVGTSQHNRAVQCVNDQTAILALLAPATPTPTVVPPTTTPGTTPPATTPPATIPPATTPPATTPPPTTTPPATGWPDATTTGTTGPLTAMACPSTGLLRLPAGAVLHNVSLDCEIWVDGAGVVINNVRLITTNNNAWAIHVAEGASLTITDSEVGGRDKTTGDVQYAIYGLNSAKITATRVNLHHCADCIQGEHVVLTDSYLHDMACIACGSSSQSHVDGYQCNYSCSGTVIQHNRIINEYGQTSAVALFQDWSGPLTNVLIQDNWLSGGGYTIYGGAGNSSSRKGASSNIRIINNRIDPGQYGWLSEWRYEGGNVCSGNKTSAGVALSC